MAITFTSTETSNRDWNYQFEVRDADTRDLIDLTGALIEIAITDTNDCERISASTTDGKIVIVSIGVFTLSIPYSETNLCPGQYNIGGYYQLSGDTLDLLDGTITVRKGRPRP